MEGNLDPLLRPPTPPAGFETVELAAPTPSKPDTHPFLVEYDGPGRQLRIGAGAFNPPPPEQGGHQEQVAVRGQTGYLTVNNDVDPSERVWLSWNEPGRWSVDDASDASSHVFYLVSAEGLTPAEVLQVAESLQPWTP
jgi:hypothetical protein